MSAVSSTALAQALPDWRAVVGADHVVADGPALVAADRACCGRSGGIEAVLYPADESEVRQCLAIAKRHGVRIHPVATGRNWGYGSRQPPRPPSVVLSLQRMDGLDGPDLRVGRVTLRPGVTFGALAARLRVDAPMWLPPEIGAGPDASVLGNALTGGIGKGPYGWMVRRLTHLKLIYPDGGVAWLDDLAKPDGHDKVTDGGVVVQADFRLQRAPALQALVWAQLVDGPLALTAALECVLPLAAERDPYQQTELLNGARLNLQSPGLIDGAGDGVHAAWLLVLTLWGDSDIEIAARQARVRRLLTRLPTVATGFEVPVGVADLPAPGREGLTSAYTLTGRPPPSDADPDRDGCGVRWISPLLPSSSAAAVAALDALGACAIAHGFAPALAIRLPDGDPVGLLGLFWNRNGAIAGVARDDARAAACADACDHEAERLGLTLYRRGPRTSSDATFAETS